MKDAVWLTDIHLEFVHSPEEVDRFLGRVMAAKPDCVLLGGDTSIATDLAEILLMLEDRLSIPVYFVLGNHDFYYSSIRQVRRLANDLTRDHARLHWLPAAGVVELTPHTGLLGHDGWGDGRLGKGADSEIYLSDYSLIEEFIGLSAGERFQKLNQLGDEAADYFRKMLPPALEGFPNLILLTHVPPFRESCWYEGHISGDEYLPHFACKAVGDEIIRAAESHPQCLLTVLCGHTHGQGEAFILPNLHVKTGGAEYGRPRLQEVITLAQ
ncbi:MAG: metallophosphoesterase [Dehalococcoidia bacterium]|nr:metallophosphoesterase [Dehalococcoidia bacterium]